MAQLLEPFEVSPELNLHEVPSEIVCLFDVIGRDEPVGEHRPSVHRIGLLLAAVLW